jgi:hypothetical protein
VRVLLLWAASLCFIPTSARIKFQLVASERVKEQAPAALTTLIEDSEYILAVFKADIKKRVIRLLDLEIKVADEALQLCFCTAVAALGVATSIHVFNCDNRLAKNLVTATIEDHQELLQHTGISAAPNTDRSTAQEFFGILKTVTNDGAAEHVVGTLDPASKILVAPAIPDFKSTLEALFLRSWDQYLVKKAETARQICVQEFVQEQLVENITADVAMDLEGITQNSQKLDEYISSKITAGTKKLQAKVDRLSEKANSNNSKNKHLLPFLTLSICFLVSNSHFRCFLFLSVWYDMIGATLRPRADITDITAPPPERQSRSKRQRNGEPSSPLTGNTSAAKTNNPSPALKKKKVTPSPALLPKKKKSAAKGNSAGKASSSGPIVAIATSAAARVISARRGLA